jgi:prolyl oligopeptidase
MRASLAHHDTAMPLPTRRFLLPLAAALLMAACATAPRPGATPRAVAVAVPPPLPARNVTETHWGVTVADPYRQLENVSDPQVQAWMRAQADAANATLAALPGRAALLERIKAIEGAAGGVTTTVIRTDNGRLFFLRRDPGENQFKLVWRDGPDGADRVVFDPEAGVAAGGPNAQPRAVMDFAPSKDGSKLAYAVQAGGGEIGTLHVIDVASGRELTPPADRIRYANASWLEDGSGLFYSRLREGYDKLPPGERFGDRTTHFRSLVDGSDRPVFSASRNPELQLPPFASAAIVQVPGTQTAAAIVFMGVDRNRQLLVADLAAARRGGPVWRRVVSSADEVTGIDIGHGHFYLTSARNAPRYRLLRMPVADPVLARAQEIVAQGDGALGDVNVARDAVYFTRREGVNTGLWRVAPAGGAPVRIALPVTGNVEIKSTSHERDGAVIGLVGWTHAFKDYAVDAAGRVSLLPLAKPGAYDAPADIEAREVTVRSHDGTLVPLSIVMKKGTRLDGNNPTILYGYGAYGVTDDPFFSPRVYAWLERGGIWATAHVRGGGVYGRDWHEAGRKTTKANTWKDGIALADWLVAQRYTRPGRLAIYGGSAGGIFVGRAITERPDLFAAAVPLVGVMDLVRMETSANGVANVPEFGTVKKEDEFKALLAASSYHQVKDGVRYPAVMAVHGVNDIRVDVWQSAKFTSRLQQAAPPDGKPVLLRLEYDAGHGQGSSRAQLQQRMADVFAFMLWQMGEAGFRLGG